MARRSAAERLRLLLAVVPWIVAHDGPTLDEVSRRFDMTEDELLAELDLVFLCGVHPFTPDSLMDVVIEEGRVWIRYADYFERPLRLTPEEGLALVAAGSALADVPGADPNGPVARALAKVAAVLGVEPGEALDIQLGSAPAETLATLREAVASHHQVELDYYTYGRDERSQRVIEPRAVYAAEGAWYVDGFCHRAGADRRFRLDRIASATRLDTTFEAPETVVRGPEAVVPGPVSVFDPDPDDPRVVLDLGPRARWVAEQYPVETADELTDGRLRVTLVAGERAWLERLLLRLGPDAEVVAGADDVGAVAARRVLARYQD
jgi:proteasome accessory factor C